MVNVNFVNNIFQGKQTMEHITQIIDCYIVLMLVIKYKWYKETPVIYLICALITLINQLIQLSYV